MQGTISLALNLVFLLVILGMILWRLKPMLRAKRQSDRISVQNFSTLDIPDDIVGVRKIQELDSMMMDVPSQQEHAVEAEVAPSLGLIFNEEQPAFEAAAKENIMIFLAAQEQNIFAGYELLQTLLSCGLRYGEGGLFHRHQHDSGQGPVLFSLASATSTGVFDLQNMGSLSVKGLCMFMELSGNATIDHERYELFMHTAKLLASELHAVLLDDKRQPLSAKTLSQFAKIIDNSVVLA